MIEENGIIDQPNPTLKQRSLLIKYEIPLDHLSFEYIEVCKDVKELERIVRILRSGEEGYYPDLQKSAEERLRSLSPNNRQLRTEEPALTKNSMNSEEWNNIVSDVSAWKKEISARDLRLAEENNNTLHEITLPPVRKPPPAKCVAEKKVGQSKPCAKLVSDYKAWEKYDADTELLKMDLEREKEERQRQNKQVETDRLEHVVKEAAVEKLSATERQVLAEEEKTRGNDYYRAKEYSEAIKYYTASIAIWPSAKAYNNRAACYLKQCKYTAALEDANSTLALEPDNVKALFRRGISLQHKNMFKQALADMKAILRLNPNQILAQQISKDLREQILTLPRTVRIMTDEGLNKPKIIKEVCVKDLTKDSLAGDSFEVNEFGLPKVMCHCNSSPPRFLQLNPRKCPTPTLQPRPTPKVNNARIVELTDEPEPAKASSTKLEIVEIENPLAVEDYFKPNKCVVVDKRTQKNILNSGDSVTNVGNGDSNAILSNGDSSVNLTNGDSGMDDDFELNCPLLEEFTEPSV